MAQSTTRPIDATTRLCGVYGHPIRHSASPAMQNAGIQSLGLNWRYLAFDVHPDDLPGALSGARAMKWIGINLTVPHKLLAVSLMDELDATARRWGAVNTVRFEAKDESGHWVPLHQLAPDHTGDIRAHGFNTDADAIARALREELDLEPANSRVVLLGAGGAGRVAALKLASEGVAKLWLVNRTTSKAEAVAAEITQQFPSVQTQLGYPSGPVDLLLNATSLGLNPADPLPLDETRFSLDRTKCVYDMIYSPAETGLLAAARKTGCRTANGLGMLLYQGAAALEIWSGRPAPADIMRVALQNHVYGPR